MIDHGCEQVITVQHKSLIASNPGSFFRVALQQGRRNRDAEDSGGIQGEEEQVPPDVPAAHREQPDFAHPQEDGAVRSGDVICPRARGYATE